ncbi:hypothetical protein C6A77_16840 [Pseudomonas sp. AFG_SD02_1510_Pfu_092]|nr:hypothetical protein C6A77_16840 [Pseudomonas sp. AFG_SD02_1510_Pfu_092]
MAASYLWLFWKGASKARSGWGVTVGAFLWGRRTRDMLKWETSHKNARMQLFPSLIMWVVIQGEATIE